MCSGGSAEEPQLGAAVVWINGSSSADTLSYESCCMGNSIFRGESSVECIPCAVGCYVPSATTCTAHIV